MVAQKNSSKRKTISPFLMFIVGFAGTSILGAIILVILITLGIVPQI